MTLNSRLGIIKLFKQIGDILRKIIEGALSDIPLFQNTKMDMSNVAIHHDKISNMLPRLYSFSLGNKNIFFPLSFGNGAAVFEMIIKL